MKAIVASFSLTKEVWHRLSARVRGGNGKTRGLSLSLVETPEPGLISSQWVKVRTIMSGVSDMDEALVVNQDLSPFGAFISFPFVPGNENLGIITETGDDVRGIEPGERVVIDPLLSCERRGVEPLCPSCARGEPSSCRNFAAGILGPGIMIGACRDTSGGWADSFVAHATQVRAIPHSMESDQAILIPEFTRAVRAVLRHPPGAGDRVIIVGAGSLGLLTMHTLRILGHANRVTVVAEYPFEGESAHKLGASEVVTGVAPATVYEEVADLVGGVVRYPEVGRVTMQGGADLVYETTGHRRCVEDALSFTGEGKKLVLMGISEPSGLDLTSLWFKGVQLRGTVFSGTETYHGEITNTFDIAMDLAAQHGLPHHEIVTHRIHIQDYQKAFQALAYRSTSKAIKVVFQHVV
jgi:threonine dehydrogenase-like Zn-dependent dehydrogenase